MPFAYAVGRASFRHLTLRVDEETKEEIVRGALACGHCKVD